MTFNRIYKLEKLKKINQFKKCGVIEYNECEHQEPICQCILCSGAESQYLLAFNLKENPNVLGMKPSSIQRRRETVNNKQLGQEDLNCTETLCDSVEPETRWNISPRPYNIEPQSASELYPHIQVS